MNFYLSAKIKLIVISALLIFGIFLVWMKEGVVLFSRYNIIQQQEKELSKLEINDIGYINSTFEKASSLGMDFKVNSNQHEQIMFEMLNQIQETVDFTMVSYKKPKSYQLNRSEVNLSELQLSLDFKSSIYLIEEIDRLQSGLFLIGVQYTKPEHSRKKLDKSLLLQLKFASFDQ